MHASLSARRFGPHTLPLLSFLARSYLGRSLGSLFSQKVANGGVTVVEVYRDKEGGWFGHAVADDGDDGDGGGGVEEEGKVEPRQEVRAGSKSEASRKGGGVYDVKNGASDEKARATSEAGAV